MNKIEELKNNYDNYNYFNVDKKLTYLIEKKVSEKEKVEYKCGFINCTRLENSKIVSKRHLGMMHDGPFLFQGRVINNDRNDWDDGQVLFKPIPRKDYTFFIIYRKDKESELLSKDEFHTDDELFNFLNRNTLFYDEPINKIESSIEENKNESYIIDIRKLENEFSYLRNVFYFLNKWRFENDKANLDDKDLNTKVIVKVKKYRKIRK